MGNGKQVLPVLQWLKVVIAFVSSYFLFILQADTHIFILLLLLLLFLLLLNSWYM